MAKIREAVKRSQDRNFKAFQELEGMIAEQQAKGPDSAVLDKLLKLKGEYFANLTGGDST